MLAEDGREAVPFSRVQNLNGLPFHLVRGYGDSASRVQATGIGAAAVPEPPSYATISGARALVGTIVVRSPRRPWSYAKLTLSPRAKQSTRIERYDPS